MLSMISRTRASVRLCSGPRRMQPTAQRALSQRARPRRASSHSAARSSAMSTATRLSAITKPPRTPWCQRTTTWRPPAGAYPADAGRVCASLARGAFILLLVIGLLSLLRKAYEPGLEYGMPPLLTLVFWLPRIAVVLAILLPFALPFIWWRSR